MRCIVPKNYLKTNLRETLRRCGYFGILDRLSGQISYIKRLSRSEYYPRWHLYLQENDRVYNFHLHLDQKRASYQGCHAHSGEYDDPLVAAEIERIKKVISSIK